MIRTARSSDLSAIAAIWNQVIRDTVFTFTSAEKSLTDMEELLNDKMQTGHGFLVAEAEGVTLGFALYGQFRGGPGYARSMEHSIYLAPEARGKALGRALLRAIEDHARAAGVHVLMAGISAQNAAARRFHAQNGYEFMVILPQVGYKFGQFHDLVLMQKILT